MAWTKAKTVIVTSAVVLLAAGTTTVAVKVIHNRPIVVQGRTESEWIKSIVYRGDDNQLKLWRSLGPRGIQMLVRALKTPPNEQNEEQASISRDTRMRAGYLLVQLGNDAKGAIPDLIRLLKTGENERDQRVRSIELSYFSDNIPGMDKKEKAALFPELISAMQSENANVRIYALVSLQFYPDQTDTVVPLMVKSLQDPSPEVRMEAVRALNKVEPQNAASSDFVPVLVECLTGSPDRFRGAAAEAATLLGELHRQPDVAVPVLIQSLQSDDPYLRYASARALGRFGVEAKPAVSALQKALEDSDARVRRQAAAALKRINSGAAPN